MKPYIKYITTLLLIILFTSTCDNNSLITWDEKNNIHNVDNNKFSYVGKKHNEALNIVFKDINAATAKAIKKTLKTNDINFIIENDVVRYVDKNFQDNNIKQLSELVRKGMTLGYNSK